MELDEASKLKTAFSTKIGQFCFNRLPFGLCTAPATFQSLMNLLFKDLLYKGVIVYLDDILIYAKNEEDHLSILKQVFTIIKQSGLMANPDKCVFGTRRLKFLGHTISNKGVETNDDKIKKIMQAPSPGCITQLRSFLGLANYYRRFIKDYALITAPLYAMLSEKEKKIYWTEDYKLSFNKLKSELATAPILAYPDMKKTMILDTDASFGAIGAVLSQNDNIGNEKVIAFASRTLNDHEKGYCVTRKELLAVHEFIMYFRHYLYGKKFLVRTDHKALTYMTKTNKPISPQFQTWIANLSSFNFILEYRKGKEHTNADGLSRIDEKLCTQCLTRHHGAKSNKSKVKFINTIETGDLNNEDIRAIQLSDSILKSIHQWLGGSSQNINVEVKKSKYFKNLDQYELIDGIVMRKNEKTLQILVPENYAEKLTQYIHEELCHLGSKKLSNT